MTTDEDILAALNGRPTGQQKAAHEATVNALRGGPTDRERAYNTAILEALGHKPTPTAGTEAAPAQRRGDSLEPVAIWAAKEAAASATRALAEALMRADANKGIYLAEAEARQIAAEAYAEAAKASPYEDRRQEAVTRVVTKMSALIIRTAEQAASKPPAKTPTQRAPQTHESAGTRRVRITEVARPGSIKIVR